MQSQGIDLSDVIQYTTVLNQNLIFEKVAQEHTHVVREDQLLYGVRPARKRLD
jgi:hypothetical protein